MSAAHTEIPLAAAALLLGVLACSAPDVAPDAPAAEPASTHDDVEAWAEED